MNVERVEALLRLLHEAEASEMVIEADGWRVAARKGAAAAAFEPVESAPAPVERLEPPETASRWHPVKAGLVGIFREYAPPVMEGDLVLAGQPLGGIESMGILNPVLAPVSGEVTHLAVRDGLGVEYGQGLL